MINVERGEPPEDLDIQGKSWRTEGVLSALARDFRSKCYLCERRVEEGCFQVDHFVLRHEDPGLRTLWSNLFLACAPCNESRPKKTPAGGFLNPTTDDVESALYQALVSYEFRPYFEARDSRAATRNTASYLDGRHNQEIPKSRALRSQIALRFGAVMERHAELVELESEGKAGSDEWRQARAILRHLVSRKGEFTALIRSRVSRFRRIRELFD